MPTVITNWAERRNRKLWCSTPTTRPTRFRSQLRRNYRRLVMRCRGITETLDCRRELSRRLFNQRINQTRAYVCTLYARRVVCMLHALSLPSTSASSDFMVLCNSVYLMIYLLHFTLAWCDWPFTRWTDQL